MSASRSETAAAAPRAIGSPLTASREGPVEQVGMLIDGRWTDAREGRSFEPVCPTTGAALAAVPDGGAPDARAAIGAAERAFPSWSRSPAEDRAAVLHEAAALLRGRGERLARLIALEAGKPLAEAGGEVAYAAGFLEFFADEATRAPRSLPRDGAPGKHVHTAATAVGPAGLITVWNFPAAGVTRPLGAALAAGCTAVLKPAERVPLSAVAVFEALDEAGLPPGVANLVAAEDPAPVAAQLIAAPSIRKLSFTGSADVGKRLLASAASQVKRVTLELGGSAPFIVFADADLETAVDGAVRSKFRNSGQTCVSADRIYVHRDLLAEFTDRFAQRAAALRVGDPLDPRTEIGPLIDAAAATRLEEQVEDALSRGAALITGTERARRIGPAGGHYFEPTVLAGAGERMRVMREETFGPLAPIAAFDSEPDVILAANRHPGGLAAFCYTQDPERASRLADRLDFGIVGVNDPLPATPALPFGGLKESGLGKEGGREGLNEFFDQRLVSMGSQ